LVFAEEGTLRSAFFRTPAGVTEKITVLETLADKIAYRGDTLAVSKSCLRLGAPTTFDRGASLRSLHRPPDALATSLRRRTPKGVRILLITKK